MTNADPGHGPTEANGLLQLIADLSPHLTDEGDDYSPEGLDNMRRRVANALPDPFCPDWLKEFRTEAIAAWNAWATPASTPAVDEPRSPSGGPGICQLTGERCPPSCSPKWQPCAAARGTPPAGDLRREVERLREALRPFAVLAKTKTVKDAMSFAKVGLMAPADLQIHRGFTVETVSAQIFADAAAALAGKETEGGE